MSKPIDLSSLDTATPCNAGAEIELRHPSTGAPLGIFIEIYGANSDVFRDYLRDKIDRDEVRERNARKRGRDIPAKTLAEREEESTEMLCTCTAGWRTGNDKTLLLYGEAMPFTIANAKKLYSKRGLEWIRNQVNEGMGDLENFM